MVVLDLLTEGMILTFCGWLKIISTVILVLEPEFHPNYYSIPDDVPLHMRNYDVQKLVLSRHKFNAIEK